MKTPTILTTALFCVAAFTATAQEVTQAEWNIRSHMKPEQAIVQSHRGAGDLAPENTVEAFELGWKLGTYPEADVRTTSDGVIVAFHDTNFQRVVKNASPELAKKGVEDVTFDELKMLDVGSWLGDRFLNRRVATIEDVFALMAGKPERHLYLDIKKVDLSKLADLVKKHKIEGQVVLASQHHDQIVEWKKLVPKSETLLWVSGKTEAEQATKFEAAKARDFEAITQVQIHTHLTTSAESIRRDFVNPFTSSDKFLISAGDVLRENNILYQTLPYGGTSAEAYWKLLDLGFMSFATDHPETTRKAIKDYYNLPTASIDDATSAAN